MTARAAHPQLKIQRARHEPVLHAGTGGWGILYKKIGAERRCLTRARSVQPGRITSDTQSNTYVYID